MRITLFILLIIFIIQPKTFAQKQQQFNPAFFEITCSRLFNNHQYDSLIKIAKQGLNLAEAAKNENDVSLMSYYYAACFDYTNNLDSAIYFYRISANTAYSINSTERFTAAQIALVNDYYNSGQPDSVTIYQKIMLVEIDTLKNDSLKTNLYKSIANIYTYKNEYENALAADLKILQYNEKRKNKHGISVSLVNVGNVYLQMSNSAKALPYLLRALPLLDYYEYGQIICADNIGAAYTNLNLYDSAVVYHKLAIRVAEKIKDTDDIYAAYEKLSAALIGKKEYNEAEKYLKPALQYALLTNTTTEIIDGENFLGEASFEQKNYNAALDYFSKALYESQQTNHKERTDELFKWLADAADSAHLYMLASKYYADYIGLNDSLTKESSKKTIAELETKYQTAQKEQQIKLLDQKSKTEELTLKNQRNKTLFLLAGILFTAALITIFMVYRNRINQLKRLTEVRNNISRNLHDEIGATLSSINIYSEVAKTKAGYNNDINQLLQRIHDGSAQAMESMSDIVWYVNPKNDSAENIIIKMREYAAPVLEAKKIKLEFNADEKLKTIKLNMQQRQNFYLLFKEAINNIAKYANAMNAAIVITYNNDNLILKISDDGKGFDINNHKHGNGLINIQQRAEFLKGNCTIKSTEGKGTSVEINFPVSL